MSHDKFEQTGLAGEHQMSACLPSEEQRKKGPYAVIECFEEIPCNPCVMSCTFDAILPFEDVNSLPIVDFDKCTGCAVCAGVCPGLAIFIVDESKPGHMGTLRLPYEYWPLPEKGQTVMALSREGMDMQPVEVAAVTNVKGARTPLVSLRMPKDKLQDVRGFRFLSEEELEGIEDIREDQADSVESLASLIDQLDSPIVCRCEGVTLQEVRDLIAAGCHTVEEIKHLSRAGMGPCQGRTCRQIIMGELMRAGIGKTAEMPPGSFRPPGGTVTLGQLAEGGESDA